MMTHVSKWLIPALGVLAIPAVTLAANTSAPLAIQDDDPEEQLDWLQDEYSNAYSAWLGKLKAAKDDATREAIQASHPANEFAPLFVAYAEEHARTDFAWQALSWVTSQLREGEHLAAAVELLARDHATDERLVDVCSSLRSSPDAGVSRGLRAIIEKSPSRDVQGVASFNLGVQLRGRANLAAGEAAAKLVAEYEKLMQTVQANYADVEMFGTTLDSWATGELFEYKNLQIGMPAPNIEGEDIDGVPFQLADYRGKVVMIDFWGHW